MGIYVTTYSINNHDDLFSANEVQSERKSGLESFYVSSKRGSHNNQCGHIYFWLEWIDKNQQIMKGLIIGKYNDGNNNLSIGMEQDLMNATIKEHLGLNDDIQYLKSDGIQLPRALRQLDIEVQHNINGFHKCDCFKNATRH